MSNQIETTIPAKQTTCAVVVHHAGELLLVHSTGLPWNQWGFPKGIKDDGESDIDAAIRELMEETGYSVPKNKLVSLGTFPYRRGEKDMSIFLFDSPVKPDVKNLTCTSTFFCPKKQMDRPEIDGFKMVPFHKFPVYFNPRMLSLYNQIKDFIEK